MMRCIRNSLLLAIFFLTAAGRLSAQFNKGGRTAFQFVKIGIGARQTALGEASISSVRDVNAVFWNPAGISGIRSTEASFNYATWFADLKHFSGAVALKWEDVGFLALSYVSLDYGKIPEALVPLSGGSGDTRTGRFFGGGDNLFGFTFSREFTDRLSIGATIKYLEERLWVYNVHLFAFDVGTFYDTRFKGIKIAMSAQNFGESVKWLESSDREEGYDIPLVFRIGTSMNLVSQDDGLVDFGENHKVVLDVDAIHTNDYSERLHIGAEYWFWNFMAIRTGYKFNYAEGNWSFGFGIEQVSEVVGIRLDYAYVNFKYLESPHRISVSFTF